PLTNATFSLDGAPAAPWNGSTTIGTVAAGTSRTLVIRATVPADTPPGTDITTNAIATSPSAAPASDSASTRVLGIAQLGLPVVAAAAGSAWAGNEMTGATARSRAALTGVPGLGVPVPVGFTTAGCSTWQAPAGISVVEVRAVGAAGSPGAASGQFGGR